MSASSPQSSDGLVDRSPHIDELDQAYHFLVQRNVPEQAANEIDLRSLRRKIDRRLVPIMFLCYTMQFVDKVSLNVGGYHLLL